MDVFVCLAQGPVCCAAREGVNGVILTGGADLRPSVNGIESVKLEVRGMEYVLFVRPQP